MSEKKQILVVDDSPNEIRVLMENLKSDYAVVAATSGEMALNAIETNVPDLVLLDVTMEPMDGYETCEALKKDHPSLPVIFVSANTRTEEVLKGFDVGGQDYITKPIDPAVLRTKIGVVFEQIARKQQLKQEKQEVSDLAMAAMSSAGDLSIILNFMRAANKMSLPEDLAEAMVKAILEYGLSASVQIRSGQGGINRSSSGEFASLEEDILSNSVNIDGRILEKGKRLIIVFESVSILVKNMPLDNEQRQGELRDYLMILAENAHDLNQKIKADQSVAQQRIAMVLEAVKDSQDTLKSIQEFQAKYKEDSIKIMDELLKDVESSFFSMGLTEEQENKITDMIHDKLNEGLKHMEEGLEMDAKLKRLTESLGELTTSL